MKQDNSLTYNPRLERTLWHIPYQFMVQQLIKGAQLGFTNYFVNNAFELRTPPEFKFPVYGWRISGGKAEITLTDCHDDIHGITGINQGTKKARCFRIALFPVSTDLIT